MRAFSDKRCDYYALTRPIGHTERDGWILPEGAVFVHTDCNGEECLMLCQTPEGGRYGELPESSNMQLPIAFKDTDLFKEISDGISAGQAIKVAGIDWVVLDPYYSTEGALCIAKDVLWEDVFAADGRNLWKFSDVRQGERLKEFRKRLGNKGALVEVAGTSQEVALMSFDDVFLLSHREWKQYKKDIPPTRRDWFTRTAEFDRYVEAIRGTDGKQLHIPADSPCGIRPACVFLLNRMEKGQDGNWRIPDCP